MDSNRRTTEKRGSLIVLSVTIILVLIIIIVGIFVGCFVKGDAKKIILFCMVIMLVLIGVGSCLFVEFQRKRALQKRDRSAELWLQRTLEEQRQNVQLSAPPLAAHTSWALTIPWRHNGHKGHNPSNTLSPYAYSNSHS